MNPKVSWQSVLRIAGLSWLLLMSFSAFVYWMLSEKFALDHDLVRVAFIVALLPPPLLLVLSFFFKSAPKRVLTRAMFVGLIGVTPMLSIGATLSFSYLAAAPSNHRVLFLFLFIPCALGWCVHSVRERRRRVIESRFVEREFSFDEARIEVRLPTKTDLSKFARSPTSNLHRLVNAIGPRLAIVIPMAYPIQRLLTDFGGDDAALLVVAMLGCPLFIYMLGKIAIGAYLWIFLVWKIERENGKPVMFEDFAVSQ